MIKFFRHIRRTLINENNMSKYFKYAIGEILLVVIGILIALQINNWNENRKANLEETKLLMDFKKGLEYDIKQMDSIKMHYERAVWSIDTILIHLENELSYTDHLDSLFFNSTLLFDSGGMTVAPYETLKSRGLNLISDKVLLDQIVNLYDEFNPWFLTWESRYTNFLFEAQGSIYKSRFKDFWGGDHKDQKVIGAMTPYAYDELVNDDEFKHHLRTQRNLIGWLIYKPSERSQIEARKLLSLIDEKLNDQ